MCIALAMKNGKIAKKYSSGAAKISEGMNEEQLKEFCEEPIRDKK